MMKINDVRSAEGYNKFQCSHPIPTTRQIHHAYNKEKRSESQWSLSDEKVFEEMMINRKVDNKRAIKQNDKKKSENKQRKGMKRDKKNSNETRMMSAPKSSGQRPKNRGQETFVESKVYSENISRQ